MKARRLLIAVPLFFCAISMGAVQIAAPSLEGIVLEMGSTTPLPNATLELRGVPDATRRYLAVSTSTGQFAFRGVPPGNYSLTVARAGYLQVQYGQRGPNSAASTVTIPAGRGVAGIRLSMMRASTISGRVHDQDGAPAVNAQLHAWKITYANGWRLAVPVVSQMTNDRGEYRLFGMPPGLYYVSAQPEPPLHLRSPAYASRAPLVPGSALAIQTGGMFAAIPDPAFARPGVRQEWAPVYYGGSTDEYAATPIYLRAGTDLGGIDIAVRRLPVGTINGVVVGPDGLPAPQVSIIVTPLGNQKFHAMPLINVLGGIITTVPAPPVRSNAMGQFRIGSLSPGTYSLTAVLASQTGQRLSGYTTVLVQGADPISVTIPISPLWDLEGRVVVEGAPNSDLSTLAVRAASTVNALADVAKVSLPPGGTFQLAGVGRGSYVLEVSQLPSDAYVKSARLGDVDVLNDGFRLENPTDRPLEVVIAVKGGAVGGIVRDSTRAPAGSLTVALVPDETRRHRLDLYRSAATDAAGRYEFRGIPPGNYKVFAWEDIEARSWMEPAYLRVFDDLGKAIAVDEGSSQTIDINAISPLER